MLCNVGIQSLLRMDAQRRTKQPPFQLRADLISALVNSAAGPSADTVALLRTNRPELFTLDGRIIFSEAQRRRIQLDTACSFVPLKRASDASSACS
jgi:hypothetical protein